MTDREIMRGLIDDNIQFADKLERGEIENADPNEARIQTLIRTYRYWGHCLYMALWLLEAVNVEDTAVGVGDG